MAIDIFLEAEGTRTQMRAAEFMPDVGDLMMITSYRQLRAKRWVVKRREWVVRQDDSLDYFNRPKQMVLYLEPAID